MWVTVLAAAIATALYAAPAETEPQALEVLKSAAPASDKEAACLRLKEIGTAKSVATLRALLADESLAQWAVDALQSTPDREAGEALLQVLPEGPAKTRALVAFALGARRDAAAVRPLARLVLDSDFVLAAAAAKALGNIGDDAAFAALRTAKPGTKGSVRTAVNDALLACADRRLAAGNADAAMAVYQALRVPGEPDAVRAAAFRGVVLCAGARQGALLVEALSSTEAVEQAMAIELARELPGAEVTAALADNTGKLAPLVQVALLEALRQRGDPAAATGVTVLTRTGEAPIRIAALQALGELGGASHVSLLAEVATSGPPAERAEARLALIALHRGDVLGAMLAELGMASPDRRAELAQVLGLRADRRAVPELLRLAAGADANLGVVAIRALEKLADDSQLGGLLELVVRAQDDPRRDAAVSAFVAVGARGRNPAGFSAAALKSMADASPEVRGALLDAAGQLGGPGVLDALRAGLKDSNAVLRETSLRTMAGNAGDAARPDLLNLARESSVDADRALALRGYWRLVEGMTEQPQPDRLAAVRAGLFATKTPAELMLGLARLAELRGSEALEVAQQYRRDAAVRAEAETACLQIATHLDAANLATAEAALRGLASEAENQRVRTEAQGWLAKLEAQAGYIAPWLVSGPYRQAGKEAQQLFDMVFAPESPDAGKAEWRLLAGTASLTNFWLADLLPVAGGDHCVVYLKTRVFCPKAQPVALEIGTDDGVKVWINGALVHANNAVRGFTVGEDKAKATLKEGWNDLLVKVTQHTLGCAAAVRVRDADGKLIPGLRVEAKE